MRKGAVLFFWLAVTAILMTGCGGPPARHYASPADFAPNSPRPLAVPRAKPDPPERPGARVAQASTTRATAKKPAPARTSAQSVSVRKGDTIYALARRYDRTPRSIIDANRLKPPYMLYPGQKLRLDAPRYHVVKRGETGYGISREYHVDVTELMRLNNIRSPYVLSVGQRLQVPTAAGPEPAKRSLAAVPAPPRRSSSRFAWPVQGRIISTFGPKQGGRHNDGINIQAPSGTPVQAAENGVVAYAGSDLKGFGNLILIRHQGGWITAYGHNGTLLVKRGDVVRRGQTIARVGTSGSVTSPQLHFEIRRGARAVNPQGYL